MGNNRQGAVNWNQAIHPETNAIDIYKQNDKEAQKYLQAGFGTEIGPVFHLLVAVIANGFQLSQQRLAVSETTFIHWCINLRGLKTGHGWVVFCRPDKYRRVGRT